MKWFSKMASGLRQSERWGEPDRIREMLVTGKAFSLLSLSSMLFFMTLGIAVMLHQQSSVSSMDSMKGFAASVSSGLFGDMLEMEMPAFQSSLSTDTLTGKEISVFLMRTLTDINPGSPSSLLAGELPGMAQSDAFLIRKGVGTDADVGPQDHSPIYEPTPDPTPADNEGGASSGNDGDEPSEGSGAGDGTDSGGKDEPNGQPTTEGRKVAFIYHSHNRESWYPELEPGAKDASSGTKNITLVGKRLAEKLEEHGVGSVVSDTDYPTAIKNYRWELSYKYSMKTVKEAMAGSDDLTYFFDLHRDSQKRKYTTVDIGGKSYAQVYFIIGHRNPNWKENEAFATKIHDELEKKYPGISRGIWGKTAATGNAEYNQSLASESVLMEIGGVDNSLDESYRTADALAEIIASIYWDAEEVSGEEE
ncbi:stage II sporulation protein P [Paenibacillus sp. LHD-117]|uniref:stage II sporulation protein P n=1 Tax=Paenibacillus sp. LHD-117 TaxID=3071412 RepID=UPI0027E09734|nr:stage II sporulation protein P [Paenibacillus sp. LHD-117]MDQ6421143.1 stage II sporulation protein P [Paenibacillus sp. LHD-117]